MPPTSDHTRQESLRVGIGECLSLRVESHFVDSGCQVISDIHRPARGCHLASGGGWGSDPAAAILHFEITVCFWFMSSYSILERKL